MVVFSLSNMYKFIWFTLPSFVCVLIYKATRMFRISGMAYFEVINQITFKKLVNVNQKLLLKLVQGGSFINCIYSLCADILRGTYQLLILWQTRIAISIVEVLNLETILIFALSSDGHLIGRGGEEEGREVDNISSSPPFLFYLRAFFVYLY